MIKCSEIVGEKCLYNPSFFQIDKFGIIENGEIKCSVPCRHGFACCYLCNNYCGNNTAKIKEEEASIIHFMRCLALKKAINDSRNIL